MRASGVGDELELAWTSYKFANVPVARQQPGDGARAEALRVTASTSREGSERKRCSAACAHVGRGRMPDDEKGALPAMKTSRGGVERWWAAR